MSKNKEGYIPVNKTKNKSVNIITNSFNVRSE